MVEFFFFFNDTATTEIYTLSLHDALPISPRRRGAHRRRRARAGDGAAARAARSQRLVPADRPQRRAERRLVDVRDRKSTRLNSSHLVNSYAGFCLKKKKMND